MNNKKMKWIEYFSENGDLWQLFVEDDYQETQADTLAHNGNEAVTRREMPAIDKVQVTIIPAARIVDKVKGQVAGEKLFHLKLSLINGDDWFAISQQAFSKEEILQCASLFVGLNKFQAERVWKSKKLGEVNTIRLENKEETNNYFHKINNIMAIPFNFVLFKKRLNLFLSKIEALGGDVEPLTIEKPATEEEIKAVEAKLGYTLPPHFREVLLENTVHLEFWWYIDDFTEEDEDFLPEELDNISSGELLFGLDLLLDNERSRKGWVKDVCPSKSEEYSRVWNNKMCFQRVVNGDYIAIELEPENYGKVVYVSHDGSENHGLYIADNFKEFLINYAAVGCTGGDDYQWEPFYTEGKGIDPTSENAQAWQKVLGINPKELEG